MHPPMPVLLIDARWDRPTNYLYAFRIHQLTPYLATYKVHHLIGPKAVQPGVDDYIQRNPVRYISGAGHGQYSSFRGYYDQLIWQAGRNLSHLKGVIVHLSSCETGAALGRSMVAAGVTAFWGYAEEFRFLRSPVRPPDLHDDPIAGSAITMDCLIDIGILERKTADEILAMVKDYVNQTINGLPLISPERAVLRHNLRHLVCPATVWGDRTATL